MRCEFLCIVFIDLTNKKNKKKTNKKKTLASGYCVV